MKKLYLLCSLLLVNNHFYSLASDNKKAEGPEAKDLNNVKAEDFVTLYYNINPNDLESFKISSMEQQKLIEAGIKDLQKYKDTLIAEESRIKKELTEGKYKTDAEMQEQVQKFQEKALEAQKKEDDLRQKQMMATAALQEEYIAILNEYLPLFSQEIFDVEGRAVVFVPMVLGPIAKQLDYSKKITDFINEKYNQKMAKKKEAAKQQKSVAKK